MQKNSPADIIFSNGVGRRRAEIKNSKYLFDPTQGDLPDNSEKANVIANIMAAPASKGAQKKMVEAVADMDAATGHTKAPSVPIP